MENGFSVRLRLLIDIEERSPRVLKPLAIIAMVQDLSALVLGRRFTIPVLNAQDLRHSRSTQSLEQALYRFLMELSEPRQHQRPIESPLVSLTLLPGNVVVTVEPLRQSHQQHLGTLLRN